jgi:hypothetical protein
MVLERCIFGSWMNWFIFVNEMINLFYWIINITCSQKKKKEIRTPWSFVLG